ncbi:uroporphyrin-III C-methyltransferase / precorrin-2 dehydrogenase / sirohydrochlorin ferrochelatase [Microbulbifer donghaiensis]|uniref:Siroheme synthase n=1 Tax=Microbulbifer donghaiensis TaxID=494016 RepID=A0A1M4V053_9GAMM|nr:siroheme synthase CysG [Microbulbifer donghaiensis]SHE62290.1 uroporphyrin-III C-methyltransferase / precorrin-2 dehydrogenase / sirohydrochlorin ferrochelatase [Microbulbifer donghaiensis]
MRYLPLAFDVKDCPCLIVGGGSVATRKARLLIKAEARLLVVAPEISDELQRLATASGGEIFREQYREELLGPAQLVIAATADADINRAVSADARARRLPVNVVDAPELCTFTFPAIVERGPLSIGISSGGAAPVLARQIRAQLEALLAPGIASLAELAARMRDRVKASLPEASRKDFWQWVFSGPVADKVVAGNVVDGENELLEALQKWQGSPAPGGEVYLVGGGPGDPDLLTFRALRLMQQADVVLYDRLVSPAVLDLVRRDAERIYVGKKKEFHSVAQDGINQLLVDLALQGKKVLRLKGGDPFIFGRGGEEIDKLAGAGIPFQVVPGITAASGCASYAGIPLTHRDHAQSVRFITGHLKEGELDLPWSELASPGQTLVFYMGLTGLQTICSQLVEHGLAADTPAALVEKGTTSEQRVVVGDLRTLPQLAETEAVEAPALTIIGGVVSLHEKLRWYHPQ